MQVPHRVSEEAGEQVLWVPESHQRRCARVLTNGFPAGDPDQQLDIPEQAACAAEVSSSSALTARLPRWCCWLALSSRRRPCWATTCKLWLADVSAVPHLGEYTSSRRWPIRLASGSGGGWSRRC